MAEGAGFFDVYLAKIHYTGDLKWYRTYGCPGHAVIRTGDGGYAVAGVYNDQTYLLKVDSGGYVDEKERLPLTLK